MGLAGLALMSDTLAVSEALPMSAKTSAAIRSEPYYVHHQLVRHFGSVAQDACSAKALEVEDESLCFLAREVPVIILHSYPLPRQPRLERRVAPQAIVFYS